MGHSRRAIAAAAIAGIVLAGPGRLWAGGALKISMVRTHDANGDMVFGVMPNATKLQLDGGGSIQPTSKGQVFLDNAVGNGGTISFMALSHAHTDHYDGLRPTLDRYVVQRYYSSFPEDDSPAESIGTTAYSNLTSRLNTEFSSPYTADANCFEIVASATPSSTAKVSGSGTNLGPGWDSNVDVLVISGEELSSSAGANSNSVAFHVWYGSNTYYLGGDATNSIETNVESKMVTNYGGSGGRIYQNVGLYKMSHHGANSSQGTAFLDEIQPTNQLRRYSFVCEGDTPSASNFETAAMGRVRDHGRLVYRSGLDGAARFASVGTGELSIIRQYTYSEGGTQSHGWDFAPPAAPGSPAASASGANVNVSWSAPSTPAGTSLKAYDVFRGTLAGGVAIALVSGEDPASSYWRTGSVSGLYTKIARVAAPGTTHQDAGLAAGTYYYRIKASHDYYYDSEYSSEVSATAADTTPPAAPTGLGVADAASDEGGKLNLSWTANTESDLQDYGVYRATYSGVLAEKVRQTWITAPGTTHQDAGLNNEATYYYQLTARDTSNNESDGSSQVSALPRDNTAPAAPTGLGVATVATTQLKLSWTANTESDLKDYQVYRSTWSSALADKTFITRITAPGTTHQDAGLVNGTTYYYRINARDTSTNVSGQSAEVSEDPQAGDSTAPAAVTDLTAAKGTNKAEVNLEWTAPGDDGNSGTATLYIVRYATYAITDSNWAQATDATGEPAPAAAGTRQSMTVGSLTVGTTYHFALKTEDEVPNTSGLSNVPSSRPKGFTNPGHVVISEVQIGGTTATDEFVELYNPTTSSINMTDWRLSKKTATGAESNLLTTFGNWNIAAGGYFLIAHATYDGAVTEDQLYSTGGSIAANNTVILYSDPGTTVVDKVGFGTAVDSETATIANPATDGSVERKPGATAPSDGNGEDTGDNSVDYAQRTTSDPQNAGSSVETAPAKPLLPNDPLAEDLSGLGGPSAFTIGPNPGTGRSPASVYFVTGWSAFTVEARIYNSVGEVVSAMEGAGSQVAQRVGHASPGYQRGRYAMALGAGAESGQPLASGVYVLRLRLVNPETGEVVPYTRKFIVIR